MARNGARRSTRCQHPRRLRHLPQPGEVLGQTQLLVEERPELGREALPDVRLHALSSLDGQRDVGAGRVILGHGHHAPDLRQRERRLLRPIGVRRIDLALPAIAVLEEQGPVRVTHLRRVRVEHRPHLRSVAGGDHASDLWVAAHECGQLVEAHGRAGALDLTEARAQRDDDVRVAASRLDDAAELHLMVGRRDGHDVVQVQVGGEAVVEQLVPALPRRREPEGSVPLGSARRALGVEGGAPAGQDRRSRVALRRRGGRRLRSHLVGAVDDEPVAARGTGEELLQDRLGDVSVEGGHRGHREPVVQGEPTAEDSEEVGGGRRDQLRHVAVRVRGHQPLEADVVEPVERGGHERAQHSRDDLGAVDRRPDVVGGVRSGVPLRHEASRRHRRVRHCIPLGPSTVPPKPCHDRQCP